MTLTATRQQRCASRAPRTDTRLRTSLLRDESGSVTTEMVIIMPVLLTMVLLLAQATVWWHAVHIAQATASDALAVTRVEDGTTAAGQHEAQRVLDQLGRGPLRGAHVTVTRTADQAEVRVTGTATSVIPFLHLPVRTHAFGPVEQFHPGVQAVP
ncbi:TadE/TadG family type IV pilus assembly protein [Streptomyces fulvoviolaceus]|uniref:TadE/TadG family type IV pilus assembly protein n=1 Tax=Streptomyces fulvoviolaceus TaxID=285535 RepID=UPI0021BEDFF4|nr:TadE family protein [Streptomyces fulvoviolaceus]MCT9080466.1 pilus assembly protein [Streptomyces fulvoviolaceus]